MFKLVLEKAKEAEIKLPTSAGSWKKQESSRKTSISALLTMPKPLTVWSGPQLGQDRLRAGALGRRGRARHPGPHQRGRRDQRSEPEKSRAGEVAPGAP